jgi:CDP-diacylglycerol--glycerol-3-phosphate 3-phosphatidyltransferase
MEVLDNFKVNVKQKVFTLPNLVSASRVPAAGLGVWAHSLNGADLFFTLIVFWIVFSDYLDGWLARNSDEVTETGKFLDPTADKIAAFVMFLYAGFAGLIPWWFVYFSIIRDVIIGIGGTLIRLKRGKALMAVWSGKVGVNVVAIYWLAVVYFPEAASLHLFLQGASFIMLLYAFNDYMHRSWKAWNGAEYN